MKHHFFRQPFCVFRGVDEMEWAIYIVVISVAAFLMMGIDKNKAKAGQRRISERTLFTIAWVGGSLGMYIGMNVFRHKTKHKSFAIGLPMIILVQIGLIVYITKFVVA